MRKIAYLVLALAAGCVYACGTDKGASPTTEAGSKSGSVNLALISTTTDGRTFRLDNASFRVTPTGEAGVSQTIAAPGEAAALQFDLPVGRYSVELLSGWQLSEVLPGGVLQKVDATVSGPVELIVSADATTDAIFHFQLVEGTGPVGTGRISFDVGTTCAPKGVAECRLAGLDCGPLDDGCGGTVDCGSCPTGSTCTAGKCVCPTTSCEALGAECGTAKDVCGNSYDCGTCPSGSACNASNQCQCVPQTCGTRVCGSVSDGCGNTLDCGSCPTGTACNAAGQCDPVCVPATECTWSCGTQPDGCGGFLNCGSCAEGQTCSSTGVCEPNACEGKTCAQLGYQCGAHSNNCGNPIDCGSCPTAADTCTPEGTCVCTPKTECVPGECGELPDGCGGIITCGCPTGQTCDATNKCVCTKKVCGENSCQTMSDGCGGELNCGECDAGTVCKDNACVCQPTTCTALGVECGSASDSCGGTLSCGSCGTDKTCNAGKCVDASQVTISYKLTDGSPWNPSASGGYCVNFTVTNKAAQDTKSWSAAVLFNDTNTTVSQSWNAVRTNVTGGANFVAYDYNAKIAKNGGTTTFGYCANFTKGYKAPTVSVTATY